MKQTSLKKEQLVLLTQSLSDLTSSASAASASASAASGDTDALIDLSRDLLMNRLDREKGSQVSDKAIFEAHSRYYEAQFLEDCTALGTARD